MVVVFIRSIDSCDVIFHDYDSSKLGNGTAFGAKQAVAAKQAPASSQPIRGRQKNDEQKSCRSRVEQQLERHCISMPATLPYSKVKPKPGEVEEGEGELLGRGGEQEASSARTEEDDEDDTYKSLSPLNAAGGDIDVYDNTRINHRRRRRRGGDGVKAAGRDEYARLSPKDQPSSETSTTTAAVATAFSSNEDAAFDYSHGDDEDGDEFERAVIAESAFRHQFYDYWKVVVKYPNFRYYLVLDLSKNAGEWLVRVAGLLVIQDWAGTGQALSHLAMATLIPKAVCSPLGGFLADNYDRRRVMMALDAIGGVAVLGYLVAVRLHSLPFFYVITAFRSALASAYYPVAKGILPLLVPDVHDLQYAVTMTSWTWAGTCTRV